MAARRKVSKARGRVARKTIRRAQAGLQRLEDELPATLAEFSKRVQRGLGSLERRIDRVELRTRRQAARLLREASHQLGRYEAEGERRWKRLTGQARRDALRLLHRLEKALEPARRTQVPRRARRSTVSGRVAAGEGI